jgi:predicted PurR-regulated permease PerM
VTGSPSCHFVTPLAGEACAESGAAGGRTLARAHRVTSGVTTEEQRPLDAAHARAREALTHYAPAEPRALGLLAIAAVAVILWVLLPVGIGVLVGALLALTLYHPYKLVAGRTGRPVLVAIGTTAAATIVVAGTLAAFIYVLVLQGIAVLATVPKALAPGGGGAEFVQRALAPVAILGLRPDEVVNRIRDALGGIATTLAGWAAQALGLAVDGVLAIFFMAMTMYYVLRHWTELARRAQRMVPINPHHTRRLMREMRRLGRTVVVGNFGTAVIQGIVAGAGYAIAHLPQPVFFGAMTAIASLVPVFGTMLVWVPAGLVLAFTGHVGSGIFLLIWGAVAVVGACDYIVRPKLVGRGETMSTWLTFVSLFGGLKLFGFVGFLLGPLLAGVSVSILRLYERSRRFRLGLS